MTILPHSMLAPARPARLVERRSRATSISVLAVLADAVVIVGVLRCCRVGLSPHGLRRSSGHCAASSASASSRRVRSCCRESSAASMTLNHYLDFRPHLRRVFTYWNITFVTLLALAFLTQVTRDYSRASMLLFYVTGLPAIMRGALRAGLDRGPRQQGRARHGATRVPDRQRRGYQRLRAALSAVEFRPAYGWRGAADAAQLVRHSARSGARRSPPTFVRRSTPRARCGPTPSISSRRGPRPRRSTLRR